MLQNPPHTVQNFLQTAQNQLQTIQTTSQTSEFIKFSKLLQMQDNTQYQAVTGYIYVL